MANIYGVGIVGLAPPESWAVVAHLPALRARSDKYRIAGVANSTAESSARAAQACGIERAFESVDALCASDDVDIVVVTVLAPHHAGIVEKALAAGKHVYCEWPLGPNFDETVRLARLAAEHDVVAVCGSQAMAHPTLRYSKSLIQDGWLGDLLFATVVADGGAWGPSIPQRYALSVDEANGGTIISVPIGHTLVGLQALLGPVETVIAEVSTRRRETKVQETGEVLQLNAPDSAIVGFRFTSGLPMSMHYRGGLNRGGGFRCEIIGTEGELHILGDSFGAIEMIDLSLRGAQTGDEALADLPVPDAYLPSPQQGIVPDNVMALYDMLYEDLETGSRSAPSFSDAVANHRIVEAISRSSREGRRLCVADL